MATKRPAAVRIPGGTRVAFAAAVARDRPELPSVIDVLPGSQITSSSTRGGDR